MTATELKSKYFFSIQMLLSAWGFSVVVWKLAGWAKLHVFNGSASGIKDWALLFYHPAEATLFNYIVFASLLALAALVLYFTPSKVYRGLHDAMSDSDGVTFAIFLAISLFLFAFTLFFFDRLRVVMPAFLLGIIPLAFCLRIDRYEKMFYFLAVGMLLAASIEPIRLAVEPVRIFNEYLDLYSDTKVGENYVNNSVFLANPKAYSNTMPLAEFVKRNLIEYSHQVTGRGPLNHIGHVLNPINEYSLGKPLTEVYVQYGAGNTLLYKWTMELFGGISIENYYKCYLFYPLYYVLFFLMLVYVFKESQYVLVGFSAVAIMHFSYNYLALSIAPGIIPTIHFFDALAFLSVFLFFSKQSLISLFLSFMFVGAGVLLNRQFGSMLAIAWVITLAFYALENYTGIKKYLVLFLPVSYFVPVFILSSKASGETSGNMLGTYFSGLFSWSPDLFYVLLTFVYFILSYAFLLALKNNKQAMKYLFLLCFVYVQGLFVYFYWSGLVNHLSLLLPFVAVQGLSAMVLFKSGSIQPNLREIITKSLEPILLVVAVSLVCIYGAYFYAGSFGKRVISANFENHKCYKWAFERANIISTINPVPFADAAETINKYSTAKGIYLISKYDTVLPFLSGHYSMLPHFELNWFILDEGKYTQVINAFIAGRPEYIFVDSDISIQRSDPWEDLEGLELSKPERASRYGRLNELRKVFLQVSSDYKLIEKGPLISVYRKHKNL